MQAIKMLLRTRAGFTLMEVVVAICLLTIAWLAAVNVIVVSRASGSVARHKIQAAYVMQQTIENLRRQAFSTIANSTTTVSLDTMGTPDNTADDLLGTQYVTVTTYNSTAAPAIQNYKAIRLEVDWNESFFGRRKLLKEYCWTCIANDAVVN